MIIDGRTLKPGEGYQYITDGDTVSTCVVLGVNASADSWHDTNDKPPVDEDAPTPAQQRERAYESEPVIRYGNGVITVDDANRLFVQYLAEGSEKTSELSALIAAAKAEIRGRYPDALEADNEAEKR